jgi:hypothetical protein
MLHHSPVPFTDQHRALSRHPAVFSNSFKLVFLNFSDSRPHATAVGFLKPACFTLGSSQFKGSRKYQATFSFFSSPFDVKVMEITGLQGNENVKGKFRYTTLLDFYKLSNHARQMISPFGSTYICEQFFKRCIL